MRWETDNDKYSFVKNLYLGRWNVGGYHLDPLRSKDSPNMWKSTCNLPGIKRDLGNFETEEGAKDWLEKTVHYWLKNCDLNG